MRIPHVQELLRTKPADDYQDLMQWWDGDAGFFKEEAAFWGSPSVLTFVDAAAAEVDDRARRKRTAKETAALQAPSRSDQAGPSSSRNKKRPTPEATGVPLAVENRIRRDVEPAGNDDVNAPTKAPKEAPFKTPLQFVNEWPSTRVGSRTTSANTDVAFMYLSAPTATFPPGFPSLELLSTKEREDRWKDVYLLWEELKELRNQVPVDKRPRRELFVCHKGKAPAQRDAYNPLLDAEVNHFAIAVVDPRDTVGARGWELVRIDSIEDRTAPHARMCSVTYLVPSTSKCDPKLAWPEGWTKWKMGELCRMVDGDKVEWQEDIPLDCIMWSSPMRISLGEAVMFLPTDKKIRTAALECTKRIERLWAENGDMSAAEFFVMSGGIRTGLPVPTEREEPDTLAE
jgi:hypothetical protein